MNIGKRLVAVSAGAILVASGPVLAQTRTAGENIDDATLITQTKFALIGDAAVGAADINIESYKGQVQLIGFVDSDEEKAAALARAVKVDGVKQVDDALLVMPGKRSFGRVIDDETVYARVKITLAKVEGLGGAADVVVMVRSGEVLIGGFVDSEDTVRDVAKAVKDVEGVKKLHNALVVKI